MVASRCDSIQALCPYLDFDRSYPSRHREEGLSGLAAHRACTMPGIRPGTLDWWTSHGPCYPLGSLSQQGLSANLRR